MQETHSISNDCQYWSNEWGGKLYFSHGTNKSKGVAILFKPSLYTLVKNNVEDTEGRYVILHLLVNNQDLILINVYGPNIDSRETFIEIAGYLNNLESGTFIWGGDFNFVWNLALDEIGGQQRTNFNARSEVLKMSQQLNLIDIWRELNPLINKFTWHSNVDTIIHCRLDFFLISRHLRTSTYKANIVPFLALITLASP